MAISELFDAHVDTYRTSIEQGSRLVRKDLDFFAEAKVHHLRQAVEQLGVDLGASAVLDVGCGPGLVDRFLRPVVSSLVGTDVSSGMIDAARRANPDVRYEPSDGVRLPFQDGRFDVAFACCVLHHVPPVQWDGFLAEMIRAVRPGGAVVVIEHNPLNPMTLRMVRSCPFDEDAVLTGPARVRRGLAQADTGRQVTNYVMFVPLGGAGTRRAERLLRRVPMGAQYVVATERAAGTRPPIETP